MAKKRVKKTKVKRPMESKLIQSESGYSCRVWRGEGYEGKGIEVPYWMNGIDVRKWYKETKQQVADYRAFKEEEEVSNPDTNI